MAARKKSDTSVNLLPDRGLGDTTAGRVLTWAITSFRIIVILTEIIVVAAFISRFWLDAQNNDLNELIKQKQAVIAANSDFEQDFRKIQNKLKIYSTITLNSNKIVDILDNIAKSLPSDVILTGINVSQDSVEMKGFTANEKSILQFITNAESQEIFSDSILGNVTTSEINASLLNFELKLLLSKGEE